MGAFSFRENVYFKQGNRWHLFDYWHILVYGLFFGTIYKFINPNAYERKNDSIDTESKDENSLK